MREATEFHYRLAGRVRGHRPGSHLGLSLGAGQEFVSHTSLYNRPDPRRLDLRASLRSLNGDWLVRVNRQRAGVAVHAMVDVSASMSFGPGRTKLQVVGGFLESLGVSAFRTGDALGMLAFDTDERSDLFVPARVSRGAGSVMAERTAAAAEGQTAGTVWPKTAAPARPHSAAGSTRSGGGDALERTAARLAGKEGLVFIVSDFHWPLQPLGRVLDLLAHAYVVPLIVWDQAEVEPPTKNGFALIHDAETGVQRTLWLRPRLRNRWRDAVSHRREELNRVFASRGVRPFYVLGAFNAEAMSKYFIEGIA